MCHKFQCAIISIPRSHFGDSSMNIEYGKKENRSEFGFPTTMSEFLDVSCVFTNVFTFAVSNRE